MNKVTLYINQLFTDANNSAKHLGKWALLLGATFCLVPTQQAYAYVDPSVMTYTIQAVAGLAVALSAVAGVAFRRSRKAIYKLLGIDENKHKVVEDDVAACQSTDSANVGAKEMHDRLNALSNRHNQRPLNYKDRFIFSAIIWEVFSFVVLVAPALEIVGSNNESLVFGLANIGWIPVVFCSTAALALAAATAALKGKHFYVVLLSVFGITIAAYAQALFMNQGMMTTDGGFIGWHEWFFVSRMIYSGLVWVAIIAAVLLLSKNQRHRALQISTGVACLLLIMQLAGVGSVAIKESKQNAETKENQKPYVTEEGILSLSPNHNILVFVLDTFDNSTLDTVLEQEPQLLEEFNGFTRYPNSLGTIIPTFNAIPYMATGVKPKANEPIKEWKAKRYEESRFVPELRRLGYTVGLYSDALMLKFAGKAEKALVKETLNIHPVNHAPVNIMATLSATLQMAMYREAPWVAKPLFWYYTSEINNRMIEELPDGDLYDTLYELDDAQLISLIRNRGLSVDDGGDEGLTLEERQEGLRPKKKPKTEKPSTSGAYRFIHTFGPHFPFSLNEEGQRVAIGSVTQLQQAKGSLLVVTEYLRQLKELGLYDRATIIVTADHGIWDVKEDPRSKIATPIMMAKPSYGAESPELHKPMGTSDAPVSHEDIFATVIDAAGGNGANFGTSLFSDIPQDRKRYYDALTNKEIIPDSPMEGEHFVEYVVEGNARNGEHWHPTGNQWLND